MTPTPARAAPRLERILWPSLAVVLLALAGCSDDTGGGAGDDGSGDFGGLDQPNPVEDYVGTWDLTGDWNGFAGDIAYLVVRPPEDDGEARVLIYDFDEPRGCYFRPSASGRAEPDGAFRQQAFLQNVFPFDDGILSLANDGSLVIVYYDTDDTDGDGDREERRTYVAPPAGLTETDLGPSC